MNVNFTPQARADLKHIRETIAADNERAAENVVSRIRQTAQTFELFPLLGRAGRIDNTREFSIPGLPYIIVYQIYSETELDILTIVHTSRQYGPED